MNDKKYTIDGEPSSAKDLIRKAKSLDSDYGADGFCLTSEASEVLRKHGYIVELNN